MFSLSVTLYGTSSLLFCQSFSPYLFRLYIRFITFFLLDFTAKKQHFLSLDKTLLQILWLWLKGLTANNELMFLIDLITIISLKIHQNVVINYATLFEFEPKFCFRVSFINRLSSRSWGSHKISLVLWLLELNVLIWVPLVLRKESC